MKKIVLQNNERPNENEVVKLTTGGYIQEVMYSRCRNTKCTIKKLNKDQYLTYATGEIREFQHNENRADDLNQIRVTLGQLRWLLNANITEVNNCRWVTLTYAENMTDTKRLKKDYEKLIKKLRYEYGKFEYIVAMEPQSRGAWHAHFVMIFEDKAPYIPNLQLAEMWGHGFVKVKKLDGVDNVGAYLTAYLGDMELNEAIENKCPINGSIKEIEYADEGGQTQKKSIIKGGRLFMYPSGFNLYRNSRGIKKPDIEYTTEQKAQKKVSGSTLTFERTIKLTDEVKSFDNTINYRYYNTVRKKIQ